MIRGRGRNEHDNNNDNEHDKGALTALHYLGKNHFLQVDKV